LLLWQEGRRNEGEKGGWRTTSNKQRKRANQWREVGPTAKQDLGVVMTPQGEHSDVLLAQAINKTEICESKYVGL